MSSPLPFWFAPPSSDDDAIAPSRPDPRDTSRHEDTTTRERSLVLRVQTGDSTALGTIVRETSPKLISFAYGLTRSRETAEDIVQEVFVAIWDRRAQWDPTSVMAYLLASVRNRAFKVARGEGVVARFRARVEGEAPMFDAVPTPHDVLEAATDARLWVQRLRMVREELDRLTERQRTAYLLRYEQGLTIPQIAEVLRISEKGAEQLVRRTVQGLRAVLRARLAETSGD